MIDAAGGRLLLLRPTLALGGVETRLVTLAEALRDAGGEATMLAGPGPLAPRARACARLQVVDWAGLGDRAVDRIVENAAAGQACAVLACEPVLLRTVPRLAARVPVVLGLHGRGDRNRMGFGLAGGRRLPEAIGLLAASGRVALYGTSAVQARANARLLGIADAAIRAVPNGVAAPPAPREVSHGPACRVAVVCRLAPEKLNNVRAAVELAGAGRAAGRPVVLDVHGSGPAAGFVRRLLARRLPAGSWRLHGTAPDGLAAAAAADVVVATGRAAVEALVMGRRVVAAKSLSDPRGQLGPLVTPATFDAVAAENFGWRSRPALAAEDVWSAIEAVGPDDVAAVRDRARAELSPARMLRGILQLAAGLDPDPPPPGGPLERAGALLDARLGGARRLPPPLDLPDRAVLLAREHGRGGW